MKKKIIQSDSLPPLPPKVAADIANIVLEVRMGKRGLVRCANIQTKEIFERKLREWLTDDEMKHVTFEIKR